MTSRLTFEVNFLGLGQDEVNFVRKNELDRIDLTLLSYRVWWADVVFTCPAFTHGVSAYALDFLYWLVEGLEIVSEKGSIELVMTGSGDVVSFTQAGDRVRVSLDRGSIEVGRRQLVDDFARCAGAAFATVVSRYPDLGKRSDLHELSRRINRLRTGGKTG